jgi:hypothetical protein
MGGAVTHVDSNKPKFAFDTARATQPEHLPEFFVWWDDVSCAQGRIDAVGRTRTSPPAPSHPQA